MIGAIAAVFAMGVKEGKREAEIVKVHAAMAQHADRIAKSEVNITALDKNMAVMGVKLASIDEASNDTRRMVRRLYERAGGNGG